MSMSTRSSNVQASTRTQATASQTRAKQKEESGFFSFFHHHGDQSQSSAAAHTPAQRKYDPATMKPKTASEVREWRIYEEQHPTKVALQKAAAKAGHKIEHVKEEASDALDYVQNAFSSAADALKEKFSHLHMPHFGQQGFIEQQIDGLKEMGNAAGFDSDDIDDLEQQAHDLDRSARKQVSHAAEKAQDEIEEETGIKAKEFFQGAKKFLSGLSE